MQSLKSLIFKQQQDYRKTAGSAGALRQLRPQRWPERGSASKQPLSKQAQVLRLHSSEVTVTRMQIVDVSSPGKGSSIKPSGCI
jgi:hypothetical protein